MRERVRREADWDVIVVGAGPAGSTAAALLAQRGWRVLVLEKEKFPRYHVGESLMPFCYFILERLGVVDKLKKSAYPRKYSVQFARPDGAVSQPFYFFEHLDHDASTTWQVTRADFDLMLLNNARARGAEVMEEMQVTQLLWANGAVSGVRTRARNGARAEFHAPVTIDASGRSALSIIRNRWRERDPKLNKVAIWTYYRGAMRDPGLDEGATTIAYIEKKGWFWYIPMTDDLVSVGLVADREYLYRKERDPERIFQSEIASSAWIEEHLASGRRKSRYYVTGEYSYRSRFCATNGLVLAGDAFAFLDPVFSSGVFLALWSGERVAKFVHRSLLKGEYGGEFFEAYGREMCQGMEVVRKLVHAFYDPDFSFGDLIREHPDLRGRLTDCLIGDLFEKDFGKLFSTMGRFSVLPEELPYGQGAASREMLGIDR